MGMGGVEGWCAHMQGHTDISQVLHAKNCCKYVLCALVQDKNFPHRRTGRSWNFERRGGFRRARGSTINGGVQVEER
jgi:hypothetical protein